MHKAEQCGHLAEQLGRVEQRLSGVAEAVELCGVAELLGVPFTLLGWFFSSLLCCKYIYFGSPASLCLLWPHQTTQLWLPLQVSSQS